METIEQKVAGAILQRKKEVRLGDEVYQVSRPTLGTLILLSEAISRIPEDLSFEPQSDDELINVCLKNAKDCRFLGDICAILILGEKGIDRDYKAPGWWPFRKKKKLKDHISARILKEYTAGEVFDMIVGLIHSLEVRDFFAVTTFLQGVNLTRPTRKVGEEEKKRKRTTASGQ